MSALRVALNVPELNVNVDYDRISQVIKSELTSTFGNSYTAQRVGDVLYTLLSGTADTTPASFLLQIKDQLYQIQQQSIKTNTLLETISQSISNIKPPQDTWSVRIQKIKEVLANMIQYIPVLHRSNKDIYPTIYLKSLVEEIQIDSALLFQVPTDNPVSFSIQDKNYNHAVLDGIGRILTIIQDDIETI